MTWPCKLLDIVGTRKVSFDPPPGGGLCGKTLLVGVDGTEYDPRDLPIGSMFFVQDNDHWPWTLGSASWLSAYYHQNNSHRRPLLVLLPGYTWFCVDGMCWSNGQRYGGWTVTGEPPNITVSPSINIGGIYHGWLQNGVVSDDCEGRKYESV